MKQLARSAEGDCAPFCRAFFVAARLRRGELGEFWNLSDSKWALVPARIAEAFGVNTALRKARGRTARLLEYKRT
jgi:hypothetical protein